MAINSSIIHSYIYDYASEIHSGAHRYIMGKVANSSIILKMQQISTGTGSQNIVKNINFFDTLEQKKFNEIKSAKNQLNELRKYVGFNISEIAAILSVQRPTIYEWLESSNEPSKKNQDRLDIIYHLFENSFANDLVSIKSYFYKKIDHNKTFLDLLKDSDLDVRRIRAALHEIINTALDVRKNVAKHDALLDKEGFEPIERKQKLKVLDRLTRKIG